MKFIPLADTHVVGAGLLYGQDPAKRLSRAVATTNAENGDAHFVIVTGGMTYWAMQRPLRGLPARSRS